MAGEKLIRTLSSFIFERRINFLLQESPGWDLKLFVSLVRICVDNNNIMIRL